MQYMRSLFASFCSDADEVEARCMLALSLFVAARSIAADHGQRTRGDVLANALALLLE